MLSGKQKHYLRGLAHQRKPIVTIGSAGLSTAVAAELDAALAHHELLKIKLPAADRDERHALLNEVCERLQAEFVQLVGRVGIIYRGKDEPRIQLPE